MNISNEKGTMDYEHSSSNTQGIVLIPLEMKVKL